jgi:hypothetical protein
MNIDQDEVAMTQAPWQLLLYKINRSLSYERNYEPPLAAEAILEICDNRIRSEFPGPYQVILDRVSNGGYRVSLQFSNREQEIEWMLKWSQT